MNQYPLATNSGTALRDVSRRGKVHDTGLVPSLSTATARRKTEGVCNCEHPLYRYTRLPFGIASAAAIFQQLMDTILQGIPHVICYLDDTSDNDHLRNLQAVFQRLQDHGFRLKTEKCLFMQQSVEYLGHKIDTQKACTHVLKGSQLW